MVHRGALLKTLAFASLLAAVWVVASTARPGTTFHFAPLIVAGISPYAYATVSPTAPTRRALAGLAVGGTIAALALAIGLSVAGSLSGPSLLPWGGALLESAVFAAVGGGIGLLALAGSS